MLLQRNLRASKSRVTTGLSYSLTQQRSQATASSFLEWRRASTQPNFNMATPSKIHLTVEDTGIVNFKPQNAETAAKTSELLQENHDVISTFPPSFTLNLSTLTLIQKHHIFYKASGFHNHIAHHLLTLYGLGAPASVIEARYKENANHQRPPFPVEERVLQDMSDPENFKKYFDQEKYYQDFLVFFQGEMEKKGWENVLNEYVFAGDERADEVFARLYAGTLT
jgi:hypothetical protein